MMLARRRASFYISTPSEELYLPTNEDDFPHRDLGMLEYLNVAKGLLKLIIKNRKYN